MFKARYGIFIAVFVLFVSGLTFAQQDTTDYRIGEPGYQSGHDMIDQDVSTVQPWTDDLRTRLNLREDQVDELNDIMLRYHRESTTLQGTPETMDNSRFELQRRYGTEIEGVLDENQRTQWQTYSTTWWDNVNNNNFQQDEFQQDQRDFERDRDDQFDTEMDTETDVDNTETDTEIR
jgi:hypothetical protein